jgi:transcriptional regulator with XRE-family HTH domain
MMRSDQEVAESAMSDSATRSRLGAVLKALRTHRGWTLAEVSRRTGFSIPTLSKVENDRLSLSYDKLIRLSEGIDVDISQLFTPVDAGAGPAAISGRRSVNRRGEGELVPTTNYDYRYLSTDVNRKKFIPILAEPRAHTLEEFGPLVRHSGEEFIYVVEGEVEVHTELYAPLTLKTGESAYLDSSMGHAYLMKGKGPCRVLAVCSASERDLRAVMETAPVQPALAKVAPAPSKPAARAEKPKRAVRRRQ